MNSCNDEYRFRWIIGVANCCCAKIGPNSNDLISINHSLRFLQPIINNDSIETISVRKSASKVHNDAHIAATGNWSTVAKAPCRVTSPSDIVLCTNVWHETRHAWKTFGRTAHGTQVQFWLSILQTSRIKPSSYTPTNSSCWRFVLVPKLANTLYLL